MKNFLQVNKAEIIRRAEWIATQTNDFQTIKAYMQARIRDIDLSAEQKEKLKRWQFVYDQSSSGNYTESEIRQQLMDHFGVTQNTSYVDVRQAKELMSTTLNINKLFKINIDIELLDIMKQKAKAANNGDTYAKLQKAQNELYKMLPDEDLAAGDDFVPHTNVIEFNPSLLGVEPIPEEQMKKLLDQIKQEFNITDIEFDDIPSNAADTSTL